MSTYLWGITYDRPTREEARRRMRAAKAEGAEYVEVNVREGEALGINNGRYQGWYSGPNYGSPYDERMAARVAARLAGDAKKHNSGTQTFMCPECVDETEEE
jgi:hypothetical protein